MKGYVYSQKLLIGTTDFKHSFGSMGHIYGDFIPTNQYKLVKSQVQEFNTSADKDFEKWFALRFNVQLENGYFIFPIGGYEILDFPDFPYEPLEFHIAGIHSHIFEDYFENKRSFISEPWQRISIEQKIDLEDELFQETGFTNASFSALIKHSSKNDVLFAVHGHNGSPFVIANLKVGHKVGVEEMFPDRNCYEDFDAFSRANYR